MQSATRWAAVLLGAYAGVFLVVWGLLVDTYGWSRIFLGLPWLAVAYLLWSRRTHVSASPARTDRDEAQGDPR